MQMYNQHHLRVHYISHKLSVLNYSFYNLLNTIKIIPKNLDCAKCIKNKCYQNLRQLYGSPSSGVYISLSSRVVLRKC